MAAIVSPGLAEGSLPVETAQLQNRELTEQNWAVAAMAVYIQQRIKIHLKFEAIQQSIRCACDLQNYYRQSMYQCNNRPFE